MPILLSYDDLVHEFSHSPSLKLLQSQNAPLILSFLFQEFKQNQQISVPYPELQAQLEMYLEHLRDRYPEERYHTNARTYIDNWADINHQILRLIPPLPGVHETIMVELTSDTERVLVWMQELQPQPFVGTDSRFHTIVHLIDSLIQHSTEDPEERLNQLKLERDRLNQEILSIEQTGQVEDLYTPIELRERLQEILTLANHLLRDFRLVEEKFRNIAKAIQSEHLKSNVSKGKLVRYVLDADEELRNSDQGRSFYAFWEILMSSHEEDELNRLLKQASLLQDDLPPQDAHFLMNLPRRLLQAGSKVVSSNTRIAEQLRFLLDEEILAENRRALTLTRECKQALLAIAENPPPDSPLLELELMPALRLPLERTFWQAESAPTTFVPPAPIEHTPENYTQLFQQAAVSEDSLKKQIATLLQRKPAVTLPELLQRFPLKQGIAEIVMYCHIASSSPQHSFDLEHNDLILCPSQQAPTEERYLSVPHILFQRKIYVS